MPPNHRDSRLTPGRIFKLVGLLAGLAGCTPKPPPSPPAPPPRPVYPPISSIKVTCPHIPAAKADKPPPRPRTGVSQALRPGYWDWSDGAYVWMPPRWETQVKGATRQWTDGYWELNGGACVWHSGSSASLAGVN